jgi:hypothetical protein
MNTITRDLLFCGGGTKWLFEKEKRKRLARRGGFLVSSWSFPYWPSSRPPFPIESHPCFLRRGHASTPRVRRGIRSASNRRPAASSSRLNYGGAYPNLPKSHTPASRKAARAPPAETISPR